MGIPDNSAIVSRMKRTTETSANLKIHNLFIFNKSGICIYGLNLTNLYPMEQEQLISSYFTALMSFTQELIGDKIKTVEMGGGIKLVVFEKKTLIYSILCSTIENLEFLEDLISKIESQFLQYVKKHNIKTDMEYIFDEQLNFVLEDIINERFNDEFDIVKQKDLINFFIELKSNDDIKGIILLNLRGNVIYSSLNDIMVKPFLKEVEFRVKISNNSILKLFYTSKNNELIFSENVNDLFIVMLIFESKIKFGMAEFYLRKVVRKIKNIIAM